MSSRLPVGENTYIFDIESAAEVARLIDQDRIVTKGMGGLLAEQASPEQFHTILDLASGPGSWALDLAFQYPGIEISGIDISKTMVDYANARARTQGLNNVSFGVMDVRKPLDFADQSFDLINARFLLGILYREDWPRLLTECRRILRQGGILRLTEADVISLTTSSAFEQISALAALALHRAGYGFSPDGGTFGMTPALARLLRESGFVKIESKAHAIRFSPYDEETYADMCANIRVGAQQGRSLLNKMGLITEEAFDKLYQQMQIEMLSDDFSGVWPYMTVWGAKP